MNDIDEDPDIAAAAANAREAIDTLRRSCDVCLLRANRVRLCAEIAAVEPRLHDGPTEDRISALRTRGLLLDALAALDRRIAAKILSQIANAATR